MQFEEIKVAGLRNHPKQFLFSDISGSEYKEFVASVRDEGLKQPLIISERTGHKVIIDGHQRLRAALEVGLKTLPAIIQPFADEREEVGVMIAANLKRRQLSRKDKAKVIEEYIKLFPERSDRWLADDLGVDEKTVGSKRGELETTAEIPQLDKTTGKDGKGRPRKQKTSEPEQPPDPDLSDYLKPRHVTGYNPARHADAPKHDPEPWNPTPEEAAEVLEPPGAELPVFRPSEGYRRLGAALDTFSRLTPPDLRQLMREEPEGYSLPLVTRLVALQELVRETLEPNGETPHEPKISSYN